MEISDLVPSSSASVEGALSLWKHFTHQNEQDIYLLYRSHSAHNVTLRHIYIQNLIGFSIGIFLFTLRAQSDAPTYASTTDQCGARSGSAQLNIWVIQWWPEV